MSFVFLPHAAASAAIKDSEQRFPIHRIYCVGRNYGDHVREMGGDPKSEPPVFFSKPATAVVSDGSDVHYPQATKDLHHEVELVVALQSGGRGINVADAMSHIYGYGVGIDFTRRDLQAIAKNNGRPWDLAKGFDDSAPLSTITPADMLAGAPAGRISLKVNDELRQDADLAEMIWSVPEIISALSEYYELKAGDLIYTGTPSGVAATNVGDRLHAVVEGVAELDFSILGALPV